MPQFCPPHRQAGPDDLEGPVLARPIGTPVPCARYRSVRMNTALLRGRLPDHRRECIRRQRRLIDHPAGLYRRQPVDPGPARQPHQEGLGHVVLRMRHQHMPQMAAPPGDQPKARLASRLHGVAPSVPGPVQRRMRPAQQGTFGCDHLCLCRRLRAETVVDRDHPQAHAEHARPAMRQSQHGHGVPASRHRQTNLGWKRGPQQGPHLFRETLVKAHRQPLHLGKNTCSSGHLTPDQSGRAQGPDVSHSTGQPSAMRLSAAELMTSEPG